MASITAIELGTDSCAFARTSVRRGEVHLSAAEVLDPAAFPGMDAFAIALRRTRRSSGLPRKCRVVLWGLPDGANRKDAAVKPLLAPLTNAGFRVDRVVTPCNALAALARLKTSRGEGSTCWLGINRGGVAIVVVRPGKLLYAHSFIWDSQIGASGSQARLLQRYSLVSVLAPEVKRAMAEARKSGTPVNAVVTCGNLPDLRSMTMPLIEELDVEVETLDSFEGLVVKPQVAEKIGESAPAIRLACAAAIARGTRPWDPAKKRSHQRAVSRYVAAAAIVLAIAGVAYQWYAKPRNAPPPALAVKVPATSPGPAPVATKAPVVSVPAPAVSVQSTNLPPKGGSYTTGTGAAVSVQSKNVAPNPAPAKPAAPPAKAAANTVPSTTIRPLFMLPLPNVPAPRASASKPPAVNPPAPAVSLPPKGGRYTAGTGALNTPAVSADKPDARVPLGIAAPREPAPPLLQDPVPRVSAILVSRDRRFATVEGGRIVGIGDLLGRRTVVAMDERSVVFQEPSGMQIRMGLGGRLLGVDRAER